MSDSERIVVVGCSLGGLRTIEALRRHGFGGEIVAVGEEPFMPYDRPPLSKQYLKGEWAPEQISLRKQGFEELEVDWRLGVRATAIDPKAHRLELSDGTSLEYGGAAIATGAAARHLPFGRDLEGVFVLRDRADADGLRRALDAGPRVVVVGAGFIGMEAAATCRQRGLEVCVVEPQPAPLMRGLGERLGRYVGDRHVAEGVDLRCGVGVTGFTGAGRVEAVELADGGRVPADAVIVGIGAAPVVDWLEGSGVAVDGGVCCDATGRTSVPDVVALGDCARWENPLYPGAPRFEHWTSAVEQSEVAAKRLIAGPEGEVEPLAQVPYVWTDQYDLRLAIAGEVGPDDAMQIGHGSLEEGRFLALFGREDRLIGAVGCKRPRQLLAARRKLAEDVGFGAACEELLA